MRIVSKDDCRGENIRQTLTGAAAAATAAAAFLGLKELKAEAEEARRAMAERVSFMMM